MTMTNERGIIVSNEEIFQHECAVNALNIIHCLMASDTNKGQFLRYRRALNRANQAGDMAPVVQKIIEYVKGVEVDLEVADIYANAFRDKINERGVIFEDYTNVKERKLIEQGGKCANPLCNNVLTPKTAQVGHIIPKKIVGNTLGEDNIQAVCQCCNAHNTTNFNVRDFIINYKMGHRF